MHIFYINKLFSFTMTTIVIKGDLGYLMRYLKFRHDEKFEAVVARVMAMVSKFEHCTNVNPFSK